MKKISEKLRQFRIRKQKKMRKKQKLSAQKRKQKLILEKAFRRRHPVAFKVNQIRNDLKRIVYKSKRWKDFPKTIVIDQEFGIEEPKMIDYFLDTASSFIDSDSSVLQFDLTNCNRVWPSGITLLCSLMQWVELTSTKHHRPKISSSNSNSKRVNSYLCHSGFYDYVSRQKDSDDTHYSNEEIVKIRRETNKGNIEKREKSIINLLRKYSALNTEEIEWFDSVILTEAFNNVSEHGVSNRDNGWWLLAQRHPSHKIISLCIADNGIGIRNSLMTGPQREEIGTKLVNTPLKDGDFIRLALEENVSGAVAASVKHGKIFKRFDSGARRGNGLKLIRKTCSDLKIPFSILSHNGFVVIDEMGQIVKNGAKNTRVFAGTMYHFTINSK